MDYALHRFTQGCGAASDTSDGAAGRRIPAVTSGSAPGRDARGRLPVGEGPAIRWRRGASRQTPPGSAAESERQAMGTTGKAVDAGADPLRVQNGVMDAAAGGRGDRETLRRPLRSIGAGGPGPLDLGEAMKLAQSFDWYAQGPAHASSPPPPPKEVGHPAKRCWRKPPAVPTTRPEIRRQTHVLKAISTDQQPCSRLFPLFLSRFSDLETSAETW